MLSLIIVSIIVSVFTLFCIFFCGAWWHTQSDEGGSLFEGDAVWLFIITAICIGMSIMCLTETGRARVKTMEKDVDKVVDEAKKWIEENKEILDITKKMYYDYH